MHIVDVLKYNSNRFPRLLRLYRSLRNWKRQLHNINPWIFFIEYICKKHIRRFGPGIATRISSLEYLVTLELDQSSRIRSLDLPKLNYLDIGARWGVPPHPRFYKDFINFYLSEPDYEEAQRLRQKGYSVTDKAFYNSEGPHTLHVTRKPGGSSLIPPHGRAEAFVLGDLRRRDVVDRISVDCTTIENFCSANNLDLDILKIDVQGSEYEILSKLGNVRPVIVTTEVSLEEIYQNQKLFWDVVNLLRPLGYFVGDAFPGPRPLPPVYRNPRQTRVSRGIPIHGDVMFLPNWFSTAGKAIIQNKPLQFAAALLIWGKEDLLRYFIDSDLFQPQHLGKIRHALAKEAKSYNLRKYKKFENQLD